MLVKVHVWRSEDSLRESVLSYNMGARNQAQVTRLDAVSTFPLELCYQPDSPGKLPRISILETKSSFFLSSFPCLGIKKAVLCYTFCTN